MDTTKGFVFCNGFRFSYDADLPMFNETAVIPVFCAPEGTIIRVTGVVVEDGFVEIYNKETRQWEKDFKITPRDVIMPHGSSCSNLETGKDFQICGDFVAPAFWILQPNRQIVRFCEKNIFSIKDGIVITSDAEKSVTDGLTKLTIKFNYTDEPPIIE
uniref:Uncharacterized protein n=1 Tax=viral metagenome TaxID=1070528 RepID=A0A6C0CDE3_9ZZZZ